MEYGRWGIAHYVGIMPVPLGESESRKSEIGGHYQKSEIRSRKSEVNSQKSEIRNQRSEVGSQRLIVRNQRSEVGSQRSESQKSVRCREK